MTAINHRFAILPIEAFYDDELTPAEFRMLGVLYSFRDKNANTVWPKLESIMDRCGYSDTTQVSRMTTKLEKKGWLTKGKKRGPRGPKIYELTVPDRVKIGRNCQVDSLRQVDISEQEKAATESQVDSAGQVDNSEHNPGVNLTLSVNSQLDCDGQLSNEHTSIIKPINHHSSVPGGTGAKAPAPVDNSLAGLDALYSSDNPVRQIFTAGVRFLGQYGHGERSARSFLGKQVSEYGESKTVDAVIKAMIYEPVEPTGWIVECLAREAKASPMTMDWEPPAGWAESVTVPIERGGEGLPLFLVRKARDAFVLWFTDAGIRHHDWLDLFRRWCLQDWKRAEHNPAECLRRWESAAVRGGFVHFQT